MNLFMQYVFKVLHHTIIGTISLLCCFEYNGRETTKDLRFIMKLKFISGKNRIYFSHNKSTYRSLYRYRRASKKDNDNVYNLTLGILIEIQFFLADEVT